MTELWYNNIKILLTNLDKFFLNKKQSKIENVNSIARFAIYLGILILILNQDIKWLSLSLILLFISYYLSITKNFLDNYPYENNIEPEPHNKNIFIYDNIKTPTYDNPFMNYLNNNILNNNKTDNIINHENNNITVDIKKNIIIDNVNNNEFIIDKNKHYSVDNVINNDLCLTSKDIKSCHPTYKIESQDKLPSKFKIDDNIKKEIKQKYREHLKFDSIDLWGKLITDRNYYTLPNIDKINDQTGFAKWCYTNDGNSGECKTDGSNCLKDRDIRYHKGRYSIEE